MLAAMDPSGRATVPWHCYLCLIPFQHGRACCGSATKIHMLSICDPFTEGVHATASIGSMLMR